MREKIHYLNASDGRKVPSSPRYSRASRHLARLNSNERAHGSGVQWHLSPDKARRTTFTAEELKASRG